MKQSKRFHLWMLALLLFISGNLFAQKAINISGTVTDEAGLPVIGANIQVVEEAGTGTITDIDGHFTLNNIPSDASLEISYIGYVTTTVKVTGNMLNIVLKEDNELLDEVVVVGYGVQRKSDLTGAVASVDTEALESRPQTNLIQSLQGTVPGLNISVTGTNAEGSSSNIRVRGERSITANNEPLIILDGIPFEGAWSEINPNDVESIEVLKDASSAAIYGARGSNGVILITSKRGEKGKVSIAYDMNVTVDTPINFPNLMNGEEFWKYKTEALKAANTTTPTEDNPEPWLGSLMPTELRMHESGRSTDWLDLATQNGIKQQHNISLRGGAEKTRYFASFNYTNVKGVAVGNQFKRYNIRLNVDQDITSWLKFSTSTQLGRYDRSGSNADIGRAYKMNPLAEPYDEEGNIRPAAWEDSSEAFAVNPLSNLNDKVSNIRAKVITNNVLEVQLPFVPGLSYKLNTGYTYESSNYRKYQGMDTYYGARSNGILNTEDWRSEEWILENIVSYVRDFGKHHLFITGLYSAQSYMKEGNTMEGKNFPNDVMYYYQMNKAGTASGSSSYVKQNHISQMLRVNYSYDSRYLFTATARRDGYSAFGDKSKFGIFPSMALGWNISNEDFYAKSSLSKVLTNLKYRLSWGKNGNEAINAYTTLPELSTFNYLNDDHTPAFGFYPSKLASPGLGWETTRSINTGIDFQLWNGRLQGSFDMYWSRTTDLLLSRSIPTINGTGSITENIGETKNHGIELQITSNNITTKDFSWSTTFNLSHYRSEIVNVGLYDENGKPMDDVASRWFIGEPISVNYDYRVIGVWQLTDPSKPDSPQDPNYQYSIPGYLKYHDKDGVNGITTDDREIIGSAIPKVNMNMTNTFRYKNFSLSIFLTSQLGQTANNYLYTAQSNSYRQNRMMVDFWTPENPSNKFPKNSLDTSVNPMDAGFYEKTDFLRLQDITLRYAFPQQWLKKITLERLEVYMNIKNLATWTSWTGLDPEYLTDQLATPATRSFTFGVKIQL